ncbi:MAG: glutamine--fructose-6-phosphate transaminase (isomerizing) [Acidilobaceae archaeon]
MSGIFGLLCKEPIKGELVYECLRRLFYRGVDGCGVAFEDDSSSIVIRKKALSIDKARDFFRLDNVWTKRAIGHVLHVIRGMPVDVNTQPHQDCSLNISVVSDGLIKNYEELKLLLQEKNHVFKTTTDVEVLPHMLEEELEAGTDFLEALRRIALKAYGMYSAIFMIKGESSLGFIARGLPIVMGISSKCFFLSSDVPSLYGVAEEAIIIEEDVVGAVTQEGFSVFSLDAWKELKSFVRKTLKRTYEYPEKGGYPHFMIKEIRETPEALRRTTLSLMEKYLRLASMIIVNSRGVVITGSGSSYHAGLLGQHYLSELAQVSASVVNASEFPYYAVGGISTGTVVIAISQSGETSDVIKSIRLAKLRGAVIIGITNTLGSRLVLHSNVYLPIGAGPEFVIPATKTFSSTVASLLILSAHVGAYKGLLSETDVKRVYNEIEVLSHDIEKSLDEIEVTAERIAKEVKDSPLIYVVGSGTLYPIALEGVLKLKEASLTHAVGLQLGELRHGHIAVLKESVPVILLEPLEREVRELYENILEVLRIRGTKVIEVGKSGDLLVPSSGKLTAPIAYAVALQMFAYKLGVIKGVSIDSPPGLAKAVTT